METAFLVCAVVGGTIFLFQFGMMMLGMGDSEMELADDVPDVDFDVDVELDADVGGDLSVDTADGEVGEDASVQGGSANALLRMLSVRTVTAALTFFGIAGSASLKAGWTSIVALVVAVVVGAIALLIVHAIMTTLYRLGHDGTVDIKQALGQSGTVYLPVPGGRDGAGKVQVTMRDRIMEYEAVTSSPEKLATGTKIIVVDVLGPSLVEVEPDSEVMAT